MINLLIVLGVVVLHCWHSAQDRRRQRRTEVNQLTDEMLEQVAGLVHSHRVMTLKSHFTNEEELI